MVVLIPNETSCVDNGYGRLAQLWQNLAANSIPEAVCTMTVDECDDFLAERCRLMAHKMREYYGKL